MSRRGGKRRQVLQLGDSSSKLHRYGYSKGFQSTESSVQSNLVTGLVGDYSDSDSDSDSNSDLKTLAEQPPIRDEQREITPPPPAVQEPLPSGTNNVGDDPMDDELRNFLSEIEAIPMPDEGKTPDRLSEGGSSPIPTSQTSVPEKAQGDVILEDFTNTSKTSAVSKKMSSAYSMFVKGDVEFANSPSSTPPPSAEAVVEQEAKTKTTSSSTVTDSDFINIPTEPTTCWQMVQDENTQYYYYWNWKTNEVTWEIPTDYTQYLLLHKEYEEKIAKIPPHIMEAWKERKSRNEKVTKSDDSTSQSATTTEREIKNVEKKSIDPSTTSAKTHLERKEEGDQDGHSHHHHKKKKSKKHKRRRNSSSDDDLDEKYLRSSEDLPSVKSLSKGNKGRIPIGPQPLSIVPYMSDDNDEISDQDSVKPGDEMKKEEVESNLELRVEPVMPAVENEKASSISPVSVTTSGDAAVKSEDVKADFESLVQNLVEFHDKMTLPSKHTDDSGSKVDTDPKEMDLDGFEVKNVMRENDEEASSHSVPDQFQKEESVLAPSEDLKNETESRNEMESAEECDNNADLKERQNIFDQFSVIRDKKEKKKKKVINMFAEDSQSEVDENNIGGDDSNVKDDPKGAAERITKSEMEDGELSDGSESLLANVVSKDTIVKRDRETDPITSMKADTKLNSEKQQASSVKGIVGYSEEDDEEEEEGELREEPKSKSKEETDRVSMAEPKKRVLQYKDYMKKYRSGDKTVVSDSVSVNSVNTGDNCDNNKVVSVTESNKSPSNLSSPSYNSKSLVENAEEEEKSAIRSLDTDKIAEKKESEVEDQKKVDEEDDSEDDIDLDDLDNIDRVLEKALEKKREQKTESKEETSIVKADVPHASSKSSSSSTTETKKTEMDRLDAGESIMNGSTMSETDMNRLKYSVKDSAELALHKLQFLDITTKNLSKLQILLVELQTRYNDWQSGGLATPYFHKQLKSSEALLSQYEESAVPPGWSCQWDRASCRYFYRNESSGHTQWEYPQHGGGGGTTAAESTSTTATTNTTTPSSSSSSKVKGEVKDTSAGGSSSRSGRSSKKRRSKDVEEKEESSSKSRGHNSTSRSSRSHRSTKKGTEKDRSKRDRHTSSSSHHHRKKKRRRREHSSSSSSSEDESTHSRHRHRSKRKKRGRSDKSPSLEVIDYEGPEPIQVIEDSPPPSVAPVDTRGDARGSGDDDHKDASHQPLSATLGLIAAYGSDQEGEDEDREDVAGDESVQKARGNVAADENGLNGDDVGHLTETKTRDTSEEVEMEGIDGVEMNRVEDVGGDETTKDGYEEEKQDGEEEVNSAVIVKPPQIIVPPYVAAMNQPQMYSAPSLYASAPALSTTTSTTGAALEHAEQEHEQGEMATSATGASHAVEESDKAGKKKKKEKSGKEKSLNANSSIMMKKKRVSSMVQKWQQVKKEVEKENRDKELRQAAIREKINQLKST